jgi:hypothetical protein
MICEAKRIWSHYLLPYSRNASRALHCGPEKWPGFSLHHQRCDYAPLPNRLPCLAPAHDRASRKSPGGRFGKVYLEPPLAPRPSGALTGLSSTTRHEGPDSPYTINTATVQPCRIDRPGSPRLLRPRLWASFSTSCRLYEPEAGRPRLFAPAAYRSGTPPNQHLPCSAL